MNLQTLQDQRKAECPMKGYMCQCSAKEKCFHNLPEGLKDFLSETARLGYVAGLEEAKRMCEEKDESKLGFDIFTEVGVDVSIYLQGYNFAVRKLKSAISSLITTNQEKV